MSSKVSLIVACVAKSVIAPTIAHGRVGLLGPGCCNAIKEISTSCWPAMFPFNPLFPPLLRQYCANVQSGAKPALIASSAKTDSKLEDASLNTFGLIPDVGTI
ncbi:hypothetical protein IFM89_006500 [Coptis chinensis]|uniref:Prolamin-like domain-containing protein n=1 Tax=Coptis chinensis TaxID=261450 RepID=A0A835M4H3_9MAGN|nr:hypothetical protein IFM89_006500 [Coptis chinensis]